MRIPLDKTHQSTMVGIEREAVRVLSLLTGMAGGAVLLQGAGVDTRSLLKTLLQSPEEALLQHTVQSLRCVDCLVWCVCVEERECVYVRACVRACICVRVCTCVCACVCMCVYKYVCMCVCMCVC